MPEQRAQQAVPVVRWENLEDREYRCPRCLHWWVSHGVPGEDDYGCGIPTSSMDERERGIFEVCGCTFAEATRSPRARGAGGRTAPRGRSRRGNAPTVATRATARSEKTAPGSASTVARR